MNKKFNALSEMTAWIVLVICCAVTVGLVTYAVVF